MSFNIESNMIPKSHIGLVTVTIHKRMFKFSDYSTKLKQHVNKLLSLPCSTVYLKFIMLKVPIIPNFMNKQKEILKDVTRCAVICSMFPPVLRKNFSAWFNTTKSTTTVLFFKTENESLDFLSSS